MIFATRRCEAAGATFAFAFAELADSARVTPALVDLRRHASTNLGTGAGPATPFPLAGSTPNPEASRIVVHGRLPNGAAVVEHAVFFARGLRVYQAAVLGPALDAEAVEAFLASLKILL